MAGKAHLGPHGPGSGHIHRSPSPGVSPFHPRVGCPPRLVPHIKNPKTPLSIPPPTTPLSQLVVTWLSHGDRAHCWPQPQSSPLQGTAAPQPLQTPCKGEPFPIFPSLAPFLPLPLRLEEQKAKLGTVPRVSPMPGWLKFPLQKPS